MNVTSESEFAITDEFAREGYIFIKGLFDACSASAAAAWLHAQEHSALAKSWTEQEPGVPLAVYSVVHAQKNPIAELVNNPQIIRIASKLMGAPTYIWSSKVNIKAPWCGSAEYYHQDLVYWKDRGYPRDDMLSCIVFLEKHSLSNAALHIIPGSHRDGLIEHHSFININGLSKRMVPPETMNHLFQNHGLKVIEADPGDALFFHSSLVHGSSHNISPDGRMVLLAQLNTVGNEPLAVSENAKRFNLERARMEFEDAGRRYKYFKEKYEHQLESDDLTFCPPIPKQER